MPDAIQSWYPTNSVKALKKAKLSCKFSTESFKHSIRYSADQSQITHVAVIYYIDDVCLK